MDKPIAALEEKLFTLGSLHALAEIVDGPYVPQPALIAEHDALQRQWIELCSLRDNPTAH
jgi:hypothetical protein